MKKIMTVLVSSLALGGCASVFDPSGASSSFSCTDPNNPDSVVDGVTCKTPFAIYQSTHEQAPLKESDLPIGVSLQDYENGTNAQAAAKQSALATVNPMTGVYHGQSYQLPGQVEPQNQPEFARPVRVPATVMRIWMAPWIDSNDDLHFPSYVYTEIQARRWAFGANEYTGRGMTVPTKVLSEVPAKAVGERANTAPPPAPAPLKPYQPNATGSQMPSLP